MTHAGRFVFLMLVLFWQIAEAQVWNDVNTWSPEWEQRYAEWVRQNWQADFFSRETLPNGQSNPYYGLRLDCADTIYSMRIIFSYESRLPFVAQDPTTIGRTISNRMRRWNHESDEQTRVREFLEYIYDLMSTVSLPNDTFPVPINRTWIHGGGLMKTTAKNHHSWSIKEILPIGVPHLIFNSTVGSHSSFELQERISWPHPEWVFEDDFTPMGTAGFRYWRPASALNKPVWEVPNYSEEQYHFPLTRWNKIAQSKLAISNESQEQTIRRLLKTACDSMVTRIQYVNEGLAALHDLKPTQCMDAATFDTYSSPSRDHRIFDDISDLRRTYKDMVKDNGAQEIPADLKSQLGKIFPYLEKTAAQEEALMTESSIDARSVCLLVYRSGRKIDLAEAKRRLFAGLMSNNPMDEVEYRWGEKQGPSPRAQACPSWGGWTPDLSQGDFQ
jgi:hypothetical protein